MTTSVLARILASTAKRFFFLLITAAMFSTVLLQHRALAAPGDVDLSFNPPPLTFQGFPSFQYAVAVQPDGKILVGGQFDAVGGIPRQLIARFNPDGSLDGTFNPPLQQVGPDFGEVYDIVIQPDGKILVAGFQFYVNGQPKVLVRLNAEDGSLDPTFNANIDAESIYRIVLQPDGKILIGSNSLGTVDGVPVNYLARLNPDGSLDTPLGAVSSANGFVFAIALQPDGKIVVGGSFYVVRLNPDGTVDPGFFQPDIGLSTVYAIALQPDGKILLGGTITGFVNNLPRHLIARLHPNGSLDVAFAPVVKQTVIWSILVQGDGKILIGGQFVSVNGITRGSIARLNSQDGSPDSFHPNPFGADSNVEDMAFQANGDVLIVGNFENVGDVPRVGFARLDNKLYRLSGSLDGTAPIVVDDDLDVYLNGELIYTDGTQLAGSRPPITFSANAGDTLRLVVRDTYGNCASLSPVFVTDPFGNGTPIHPGFSLGCGRPPTDQGVVLDHSFVIPAVSNNAPPVLSNLAVTTPINENGTATLTGNISDPDAGDAFTLTVDWGDGSAPQVFNYAAGTASFSETHQYLDDNPTATFLDANTINLTLSDGAKNDTDAISVGVNNIAPSLSNLLISPSTITVGDLTTMSGNVDDVGTFDSHTVQINWGDGSTNTTLNLAAGVSAFNASHQYNTAGNFTIAITATDDDTGNVNAGAGSVTVNAPPPPSNAPNAPSNLKGAAISKTQISLKWVDNSNNELGFLIERCTGKNCTTFVQVGSTDANVTTFTDSGLNRATFYTYRVRAYNVDGTSAYSNTEKDKTK